MRSRQPRGCHTGWRIPGRRDHLRDWPPPIRGHQRSSEVIRGHQRSSAVISGHQRSSEVGEITREIGALHQPTHGREDDPEHVGEVTLGAPTLRRADTPLGPRCLRQTVLCPFGKRGKKSSSVAIRGHQRSSAVVSGTHRYSSEVISGHQRSSAVISGHQRSSVVLSGTQWQSVVIRGHQRSSAVVSGTHLAIGPA